MLSVRLEIPEWMDSDLRVTEDGFGHSNLSNFKVPGTLSGLAGSAPGIRYGQTAQITGPRNEQVNGQFTEKITQSSSPYVTSGPQEHYFYTPSFYQSKPGSRTVVNTNRVKSKDLKFGIDRILKKEENGPSEVACHAQFYQKPVACELSPCPPDHVTIPSGHFVQPSDAGHFQYFGWQEAGNFRPPSFQICPENGHVQGPYSVLYEGSHTHTHKRKRTWSRAVFSSLQRRGLEKRFEVQKYVTKPDRRQLASILGLTDAQVKVWFQNRRMKWRHSKAKERVEKNE